MLRHPNILGDPGGRKYYVTLAFSGMPNKGEPLGPREGRGEVATSDFVPLCWGLLLVLLPFVGDPPKWRGGLAFSPLIGPLRRQG